LKNTVAKEGIRAKKFRTNNNKPENIQNAPFSQTLSHSTPNLISSSLMTEKFPHTNTHKTFNSGYLKDPKLLEIESNNSSTNKKYADDSITNYTERNIDSMISPQQQLSTTSTPLNNFEKPNSSAILLYTTNYTKVAGADSDSSTVQSLNYENKAKNNDQIKDSANTNDNENKNGTVQIDAQMENKHEQQTETQNEKTERQKQFERYNMRKKAKQIQSLVEEFYVQLNLDLEEMQALFSQNEKRRADIVLLAAQAAHERTTLSRALRAIRKKEGGGEVGRLERSHIALSENMRKWQQLMHQLDTEASLTALPNLALRRSLTPLLPSAMGPVSLSSSLRRPTHMAALDPNTGAVPANGGGGSGGGSDSGHGGGGGGGGGNPAEPNGGKPAGPLSKERPGAGLRGNKGTDRTRNADYILRVGSGGSGGPLPSASQWSLQHYSSGEDHADRFNALATLSASHERLTTRSRKSSRSRRLGFGFRNTPTRSVGGSFSDLSVSDYSGSASSSVDITPTSSLSTSPTSSAAQSDDEEDLPDDNVIIENKEKEKQKTKLQNVAAHAPRRTLSSSSSTPTRLPSSGTAATKSTSGPSLSSVSGSASGPPTPTHAHPHDPPDPGPERRYSLLLESTAAVMRNVDLWTEGSSSTNSPATSEAPSPTCTPPSSPPHDRPSSPIIQAFLPSASISPE
jgi:hypothetical protein